MSDVISHGFDSFTLGRIRKKKKNKEPTPYVAHSRSQSSTMEADTIDVDVVNQVHQKIFSSSSSSSSLIGNLLNSSLSTSGFRAPPGNSSYSTWTIPRTNRIPKRTLSSRSIKESAEESFTLDVEEVEQILDFQRSSFDNITGTIIIKPSSLEL